MGDTPDEVAHQYDLEPTLAELEFVGAGPAEEDELQLVATTQLPPGARLTVPKDSDGPIQAALAEANRQARADSIDRLAGWFNGYDFAAAAQTTDDRRFMLLNLDGSLLDHLDAGASLSRTLTHKDHHWGIQGVSFVHGDEHGHRAPPPFVTQHSTSNGSRMEIGGLVEALRKDWTAVVNSADRYDPRLAAVCDDLSRAYGTSVNTNVYISWTGAKGFGSHWDMHDTIIVPVHGAKDWAVFPPKVLSAQRPWVGPDTADDALWSGRIEPGQCLVIPRGWGHTVSGTDHLSIHYTIGISRLEMRSMVNRVAWETGYWPWMRADVPYDPDNEIISYEGSALDDPDGIAKILAQLATPELVDWSIASHRARVAGRRFPGLLQTFAAAAGEQWSDKTLRIAAPAGVQWGGEREGGSVVAFDNRAIQVASVAMDAFCALAAGRPLRVDELPAIDHLGDQRSRFSQQLVLAGLAQVADE